MRASRLAFLLAATPAFAQEPTYFTGLLQTLSSSGLNKLASVAQNISNTTIGQGLFAELPNGNNTLFAPNDNAFTGTPPSNITDPNELASILSYHVAYGAFNNFATSPNSTIMRTALNNTNNVTLEGDKGQVLIASNQSGTVKILQQDSPVSVLSTTTYRNLVIHTVDAVIDIPPKLSQALNSRNLTDFVNATQQTGDFNALESAHGITIFAPSNSAFNQNVMSTVGSNATLEDIVLGNHIINGTSVYSTEFHQDNYTSASGEPFQLTTNTSGMYVSSGQNTAKVIDPDVITSNGVVHVIDSVLLNTQNNTDAANSAYASATSVAAHKTTETLGVGVTATNPGATGTSTPGASGASAVGIPVHEWATVFILALAGAALVP